MHHNKPPCRNYAISGTCTFGSNCRFDHYTETPLVDPPSWIFSHFNDTQLNEYSFEEMRAYFYLSCLEGTQQKFVKHYDSLWLENYKNLSDKLSEMCSYGMVSSDTERIIDYRKQPDIFCKPFNENLLAEAREENNNEPMEVEEDKMWGSNEIRSGRPNDGGERQPRKGEGKYERKYNDSSQRRSTNYEHKRDDHDSGYYHRDNRNIGRSQGHGKYASKDENGGISGHKDGYNSRSNARDGLDSMFEPEHGKKDERR